MGWLCAMSLALIGQVSASEAAPFAGAANGDRVTLGDLGGFPWSHAVVGDLDGDGLRDLVLTATQSNALHVHSARTGRRLYVVREEDGSAFGHTIAALGDLDGDRVPDFAAASGAGAHLISGRNGAPIDRLDPCGSGGDSLGFFAVEAIPDTDGDGQPELALADYEYHPRLGSWHVHVLSLARCTELFRAPLDSGLEPRLQGLPDLDGDGGGELLIASPFSVPEVISGNDGHGLFRLEAADTWQAVAAWRPHEHAPWELALAFPDALLFCSGRDGHPIHELPSSAIDSDGVSVACGADSNGDGVGDFLIVWNTGWNEESVSEVVSGRDGTVLTAVTGSSWDDLSWGAFLDDLDGDGTPDFVVGGDPLYAGPDPSPRPTRFHSGRTGELLHTLPESQFLP